MVMIFAGGHISGGHFNPAVTLGVWLRGKCETKDVAPYMIFSDRGGGVGGLGRQVLKGRGRCCSAPTADCTSASGGVSFHPCARFRRAECGYGKGYVGKFFLWAGDRIHGAGGGVFRRQHLRRRVQPGGRDGNLRYVAIVVGEYLDIPDS
jgi:hypothetical protein